MIAGIFTPFGYQFFRNGLTVAVLAGAVCGIIGVYVVLRGMSYIGHGLSHAVFGGAAAAAVININYFLGAGLWGVLSGLLIGRVARRRIIGADAAIGVVTTASFALGIVLFNKFGRARKSLDAVLFGDILGVDISDVIAVVLVLILVLGVVVLGYRRLLFATFDPDVAAVSGVRVERVEAVLMTLLSLTVLVTMRVIGVLLISALLVIPPTIARMMTNSFARMLVLSPIIGATTCMIGMNLSYHLDTSSGATIILTNAALFAVVFSATGVRGRRNASGLDHGHGAPALRAAA
jgi:ABC-type Mn2+/Zn2+ transport system permease subunit